LSASIATPVIGRLGDMYGKERVLVVVLVLLCVATAVSALATTLAVMLVGRVVQGAARIAVLLFVPESPVRVPGRVNWAGRR
jgi:MFS family permease